MDPCFQLGAQFGEIVNFAIEHDPDTLVFVMNRLPAAHEIDDAKPPHAEPDRSLSIDAFIIGPAVDDGLAHSTHFIRIDSFVASPDNSRYPAHSGSPMSIMLATL